MGGQALSHLPYPGHLPYYCLFLSVALAARRQAGVSEILVHSHFDESAEAGIALLEHPGTPLCGLVFCEKESSRADKDFSNRSGNARGAARAGDSLFGRDRRDRESRETTLDRKRIQD